MQRLYLMPENPGRWRRAFFSVVLASVEFFVAFLAVIGGLPILLSPTHLAPLSIIALLPGWMIYIWAGGLVLGGLLSIVGILFYNYRIERAGAMTLAMTAFVFCIALVSLFPASWLAFITYLVFMLAMLARYWVLGKLITAIGRVRKHTNGKR